MFGDIFQCIVTLAYALNNYNAVFLLWRDCIMISELHTYSACVQLTVTLLSMQDAFGACF